MRRLLAAGIAWACVIGAALAPAGCVAVGPDNPRFEISESDLNAQWRRMRDNPVELERPVVVVGSYRGPDPFVSSMTHRLAQLTSGKGSDFVRIPTWFDGTSQTVIDRTVKLTASRLGTSEDGTETVEVDVVGLSMGGVIARAAALPAEGRPRLKIRRLYTIASPHRGATLAGNFAPDDCARDLMADSEFIKSINAAYADRDYELICYGVLRDGVVGVENTAPPGEVPIWTRGQFWGSHLTVNENHRILADIALRLRGDPPISQPGEPLPQRASAAAP